MITRDKLVRISDVIWEIPTSYRADMKVPARFFASEAMLDDVFKDRSLEQLVNVSTLKGAVKAVYAMPDMHEGYGFPIGGVAAMAFPHGMISPGGIGYDINCGVRLLRSPLTFEQASPKFESLAREMFHQVPSGVGRGGAMKLDEAALDDVFTLGVRFMLREGFAFEEDLKHIESYGCLGNADPTQVSQHARQRGSDQLGTLGAGNHFAEVDVVDEIYDEEAAKALGLFKGQVVVQIHTGSRGLGHQVATDHLKIMNAAMPKYGVELPDRELACVPFSSKEGQNYYNAMAAAANYAWCNRQRITWGIRKAWEKEFGLPEHELKLVYDVAHNIAKLEDHVVDGKREKLIIHRKGATRAFGPGNSELTPEYQKIGQPVLIPGSMGTASYVLVGTEKGMEVSFGSCCHGAGRVMSRHAAKKQIQGKVLRDELKSRGIIVNTGSVRGLAEEAPQAYKDVDEVVETVAKAGIAKKVVRLKPCVVVKG